MRFHVVSLPHTQTTRAYTHCAYTEKVRKFCDMMMALGHEVFLYASEDNEANVTELITCITKKEQKDMIGVEGPLDNGKLEFVPGKDYWNLMNIRAIEGIKEHKKPQDFVCLIAGLCQKPIADALPDIMTVEFGIGYGGVFAPYKVFESYAWMHTVYGAMTGGDSHQADGHYYDTVIPNYFDPADFPFSEEKDDYLLFMGRLIERKGYQVAVETAKQLGKRLIIAGQGEPPEGDNIEYVGVVGPEERGKLMSRAQAVFVPTKYVEPFGGVAVEAMLCGTPVLTPDWGAFTETVVDGVSGFRCHTLGDYMRGVLAAKGLDKHWIRNYAVSRFSMDVVAQQYENYFKRLLTLYSDGWYATI